MKEEVIKKYVKDLNGLLKEVNEIGDYFLAWKGFPNHSMVICPVSIDVLELKRFWETKP
jgi:hypothetical protein